MSHGGGAGHLKARLLPVGDVAQAWPTPALGIETTGESQQLLRALTTRSWQRPEASHPRLRGLSPHHGRRGAGLPKWGPRTT